MTIASASGVIGKLQQWVVERGRATFFNPDQLAAALDAVGLSSFKYWQYRVSLVFRANKDLNRTGIVGGREGRVD